MFSWEFLKIFRTVLGQFPPGQFPRGQLRPGQLAPGQFPPWTISLTQFPPRAIDGFPPRTITLLTNYNFLMAIFCFFFIAQLYNYCFSNKSYNGNSNKTWSLNLLIVVIL